MNYITTSDGRVGLPLSEYKGHRVEIKKPHVLAGNYAELVVNGKIIRYETNAEALEAGKEITQQLKSIKSS